MPGHSRFGGPNIQSVSLTRIIISNFIHRNTVGPGTRTFSPRGVLLNRRYRLELSDGPGGLRPVVPSHPGCPSEAHDGFPPCRRPPARRTSDNPLPPVERTGYHFSPLTGLPLVETGMSGRVRVAHLHLKMSKSGFDRTGEFHLRAPVATGRARLKASGYSNRSGRAG